MMHAHELGYEGAVVHRDLAAPRASATSRLTWHGFFSYLTWGSALTPAQSLAKAASQSGLYPEQRQNPQQRLRHASLVLRLGSLGAVLRSTLFRRLLHPRPCRACHADDVIANARQVLHATTADEHQRVLLEVVPLPRDVRCVTSMLVRQPHTRNLAQAPSSAFLGVWVNTRTQTPRRCGHRLQRRALALALVTRVSTFSDELTDRRHERLPHVQMTPLRAKTLVGQDAWQNECAPGLEAVPEPRQTWHLRRG